MSGQMVIIHHVCHKSCVCTQKYISNRTEYKRKYYALMYGTFCWTWFSTNCSS